MPATGHGGVGVSFGSRSGRARRQGGRPGEPQQVPHPPGPLPLARAFSYTKRYCQDICFDNLYVTTYFRQIDARRRKQVRGGEVAEGGPPSLAGGPGGLR